MQFDITNGTAIDWPRFLKTQSCASNFVSDGGISKVFAARLIAGEAPYFIFCYPDTSFTAKQTCYPKTFHKQLAKHPCLGQRAGFLHAIAAIGI